MSLWHGQLGAWKFQLTDYVVEVTPDVVARIEHYVNGTVLPAIAENNARIGGMPNWMLANFGVPSLLIRLDMPHLSGAEDVHIYECEQNVAGYGTTAVLEERAGSDRLVMTVASSLADLGIDKLMYGTLEYRRDQHEDLEHFMMLLQNYGIAIQPLASAPVSSSVPLWLRAGHEDYLGGGVLNQLHDRTLLWHLHSGGHKGYLVSISRAQYLSDILHLFHPYLNRPDEVSASRVRECVQERFPTGVTIKPVGNWGCHGMRSWSPIAPYNRQETMTRLLRMIQEIVAGDVAEDYLAQPYFPAECIQRTGSKKPVFRMWRIYLAYFREGFRFAGGYFIERDTPILHGASDAVFGQIVVV